MNSSTDWDALWGGMFLMSFLVAVPFAVPLLFLLRASVRRFMRQRTRVPVAAPPSAVRRTAPPLHLVNAVAPGRPHGQAGRVLFARMQRARYTAAALYGMAGVVAASVGGTHCLWPTLLIMASVAVPSFPVRTLGLLVFYLAVFVPAESFTMHTFPPTLLLMLVVNRWLKTLSLVVALVGFAAFGAMGAAMIAKEPYGDMGWLAAVFPFFALFLFLVHLIVRAYERKLFSDASYQFMFVWLIFVPWWVYLDQVWWPTLAALAAYAAITALTLPLLQRAARRHRPVSLLVLRVFGSPGRSRRLFEELGTRWRYVGPIHLIAGADSATTNFDLAEAVRYLTFRFRSLYVSDEADLERRLASLDCAPDPDGRYRVNDFFCFDDTWQRTFTELLRRSDVVLVDLSGFGPRNAGVAYELGHLLAERPLDSFVLVTDDRTDIDLLGTTLQRLWRELDPASPNARLEHPTLRVLHEPKPHRLVAALCDAAR